MIMSQEEDTLLTVGRVNLTPEHTEGSAPNSFQNGLIMRLWTNICSFDRKLLLKVSYFRNEILVSFQKKQRKCRIFNIINIIAPLGMLQAANKKQND